MHACPARVRAELWILALAWAGSTAPVPIPRELLVAAFALLDCADPRARS
jgi:hypothetical protein